VELDGELLEELALQDALSANFLHIIFICKGKILTNNNDEIRLLLIDGHLKMEIR